MAARLGPWLAVLLAGCSVSGSLFEGLPCPCGPGWSCDEARRVCVRGAATDAAAPDASPDATAPLDGALDGGERPSPPPPMATTCWSRLATCDWADPGFTLEAASTMERYSPSSRTPSFSPDGCAILYASDGALFRVERSGAGRPFGAPEPIELPDASPARLESPTISPDGLELFVASDEGDSTTRRVYRAERAIPSGPFDPPVLVPGLSPAGVVTWEPRLAPHGLRFYYAPYGSVQFIHVSERAGLGDDFVGSSEVVPDGVEPGYQTNRPSVTHHERVLLAVQQVLNEGPTRVAFYSTREHWRAPWSRVRPLPLALPINALADLAISPDGCEAVVFHDGDQVSLLRYVDR